MRLLEIKEKYAVDSEEEAYAAEASFKERAFTEGYKILNCGHTYKSKKAKGEIVGEQWIVEIVKQFDELWSDL